jgi:hypothetical protein
MWQEKMSWKKKMRLDFLSRVEEESNGNNWIAGALPNARSVDILVPVLKFGQCRISLWLVTIDHVGFWGVDNNYPKWTAFVITPYSMYTTPIFYRNNKIDPIRYNWWHYSYSLAQC